jgi:hypothetical protein
LQNYWGKRKKIAYYRSLVFSYSYNQVMFEDATQNRMQEQLTLFETIANNKLFATCPIFL